MLFMLLFYHIFLLQKFFSYFPLKPRSYGPKNTVILRLPDYSVPVTSFLEKKALGSQAGWLTRNHDSCWASFPLTLASQMYVPGKLHDVEHVLIDVGTGYYVEKVSGRSHVDSPQSNERKFRGRFRGRMGSPLSPFITSDL